MTKASQIHCIQKIQKALRQRKLPAALISKPENVRYLCGYTGTNGRLLITPKQATLITDFRYIRSARKQIPKRVGIYDQKKGAELKNLLVKFKTLGIEEGTITHAQFLALKKLLPKCRLKPISGLVEELRMVKSLDEIRIIKKAVKMADEAFRCLVASIRLGESEKDLAWRLASIAHDLGADGFSFPPIIAFGKNSADVHHEPNDRRLKKGDMILIDMGLKYKGYCTDMTRTIFTHKPNKIEQKIYSIVLDANQSAIKAIKSGLKAADVDHVARGIIEKAGYGQHFGHALGHGVGLEMHEAPNINPPSPKRLRRAGEKSEVILKPGMMFTIEPGIYLDRVGGVRLEDMVYVNEKGQVEVLTKANKKIQTIFTK